MNHAPVLFDLSHFVRQPLRTGVQRVCHEIISRWPDRSLLKPACIRDDGRLYLLPDQFLTSYIHFFQQPADRLSEAGAHIIAEARATAVRLPKHRWRDYQAFVRAEVLFDPPRLTWTERAIKAGYASWLRWFVYDLLPWTYPQFFAPQAAASMFDFLRLLRSLPHLAFDSVETRHDYLRVVPQGHAGPVLQLGADGLGTAPPVFQPSSRRFAIVGTIEPRKNHTIVLDAFESLWSQGVNVELVLAGSMGWVAEEVRQRITRLQHEQPRFRWANSLADDALADLIRSCRATIYPAISEGYGLPPVESLALGVPVIVAEQLPSVAMLPATGQYRLRELNSLAVRQAVAALLDDRVAVQLTHDINRLKLPTWAEFARQFAAWVEMNSPSATK